MSMCASLSSRNCFSSSWPKSLSPHCSQMLCVTSDGLSLGPSLGWIIIIIIIIFFLLDCTIKVIWNKNNNQKSGTVCSMVQTRWHGAPCKMIKWSSAVEELLPCGILCFYSIAWKDRKTFSLNEIIVYWKEKWICRYSIKQRLISWHKVLFSLNCVRPTVIFRWWVITRKPQ